MSNHIISSIEQLEAVYDEVNPISLAKETDYLTPAYQSWLEKSAFFALATSGPEGLDCSPRGDQEGTLFKIVDNRTLLIPDRRGNNRIDSLRNMLRDPRIATMFLIPGISECLRINGTATLSTDPELTGQFDVDGKIPRVVIILKIEAVYFQCARAIIRSGLWKPENIKSKDEVPTAGAMTKSAKEDFDAAEYDAALPQRQKDTLY
ncbi:pyridoxamine 5'-phosphate oxidase family protein [Sneathiella sp. P13V-1]|uniref:pyridoxamine 5'-phosphate oxidase family protein n=1 Tax=Sneathiella sp. P13V-1 TaxID=2697366 RepID=UPI00187B50A9|nr:pyridoxamine 5'-phosphate oxidase family protein [Sneathiella sp. P13V-1]MBE7637108.1 pyridoxamine 5'-phosphate oxidase family protein [Sneathiella sp. P13V-1]